MTKTAIILAQDDKGLQPVFGIPALRRLALIVTRLGIGDIHIIGQVHSAAPVLSDLIPPRFFHLADDEHSLDRALNSLQLESDESVLVLKSNHVVDRHSLAGFLEFKDERPVCYTDSKNGSIAHGIFCAPPQHISPILHAMWSGEKLDPAVLSELQYVHSAEGTPHLLDGNDEGAAISEQKLVTALSRQTKADDGFIARHFDRRISQYISRRLAKTGLSPNHVTLAGMTIGLTGALLLSMAGYWSHLAGALLFVACVIVDGVDGELARLKLMESSFGHYLDIITDNIVHLAIFVGIAFGLYHTTGAEGYLTALWFLLGGFALCLVAVYYCILRLSDDELKASPKTIRFMALLSNRDFAYLVALLAIFDRLEWFLTGSAIGSYAFAVSLWFMSRRERTSLPSHTC